ncbi:MAG: hypothetical protein E7291_02005 [Lachnospiraceae bacterium]|nr:hypothetical protein [Lachnospiraceae bacterium]
MKIVKGISLFFIYPLIMFGIGFYAGVECMHFFYPGDVTQNIEELPEENWPEQIVDKLENEATRDGQGIEGMEEGATDLKAEMEESALFEMELADVSASDETLTVDTKYVLEETDIVNQSVVETVWKLPAEYIGMDREQFLIAMEEFEMYPPLSELERGFVSLEVLSFSKERVVVQMNYQYVQPSNSFYLAVYDNEVVVYLEDMETIYIYTGIMLEELPEDIQSEIIQMLWVEDEESLYHFLENYSS